MAVVVVDIEREFPLHEVPDAVNHLDEWVLTSFASAARDYMHPETRFVVGLYGREGQAELTDRVALIREAKGQCKGVIIASRETPETIEERLGLKQGVDYDAYHQKPYRIDALTETTTRLKYSGKE